MGMTAGSSGGQNANMNVTPLIDVLLVLLIIFMVISPVTPKGLDALVPQPPPPNQPKVNTPDRTIVVQLLDRGAGQEPGLKINTDDATWDKTAKFIVDGNVAWESPLGEMLFGFLFDAIHHRGQLSAYLRPMGAKVPSIYGPSADDPGM